jgi:TFIIF-interacting CTD phosphatase-like protein
VPAVAVKINPPGIHATEAETYNPRIKSKSGNMFRERRQQNHVALKPLNTFLQVTQPANQSGLLSLDDVGKARCGLTPLNATVTIQRCAVERRTGSSLETEQVAPRTPDAKLTRCQQEKSTEERHHIADANVGGS